MSLFSHTIVDGVPDPVATITQDTAGVSGSEESGDEFGASVSVVSYRPSASAPIGALIAVGAPGETLDGRREAGMAHVLAVTPSGKVTELSDVHQNTSGVTGTAEENDEFGGDVVLGVRDGGPTATPATAILAVTAYREVTEPGAVGAVQVFGSVRTPGDTDVWLGGDETGCSTLAATGTGLLLGARGQFNGPELSWDSILP